MSASEAISDSPSGMLMDGIMSTLAEYYSLNLATEIMKGMDQKAKKGGLNGLAPIGYINVQFFDGRSTKPIRDVEVDPDRAPLVQWAFEATPTGDYTLHQLTEALADRGLTTRPTNAWPARPLPVQRVHDATNRVYAGLVKWHGAEYRGRHEPLDRLRPSLPYKRSSRAGRRPCQAHQVPALLSRIALLGVGADRGWDSTKPMAVAASTTTSSVGLDTAGPDVTCLTSRSTS